MQFCHFFVHSH